MLSFILSAQLLLHRLSNTQDYSFFFWLLAINYLDITCLFKGFSLIALEGGLITSIKYAINPQGEIILVELELCCLGDY